MRKFVPALLLLVIAAMVFTQVAAKEKPASLVIGSGVPQFSLQDQTGKTVNLSDYKGKIVVLEWFNDGCPFVVKHYSTGHMNALASKYMAEGVVWLAINSTHDRDNAHNLKVAGDWKIDRPILNDSTGTVGKAYDAKNTPGMYIINKDQTLAYHGAIDSKPSTDAADLDGATNYVAKALDELLANKPVSQPETKPYGCGVKYAD